MSHVSHHRKAARARGRRPWCAECVTDEHLVIESFQALHPRRSGLVGAACTCSGLPARQYLQLSPTFPGILPQVDGRWDDFSMGEKNTEAPREHGRYQDGYVGSPTTQQLRIIGQRRRDAEEKLEHHLEKVRHKDDLQGMAAVNHEDTADGL